MADETMLVCSGCGEKYRADQAEGTMHDHWTAAAEDKAWPPRDMENK